MQIEKSLENKAFWGFCILIKIVKMAEMLENKGFYRTQSKNATELITEHCYFLLLSISTNCEINSISLSFNPVTSIFLVLVIPNK